ncbi:hypothetical protein LOD99_14898 [Oopsacas minuta]|uniref:TRAF-type domain-containing protein n=1 Tax=Oopsacas minuta TaxID=111878 RepID=A0AAV7KEE0_9METZ|nr:hypothetical protein LOD99_14898 [Oopsacas minuta]
MTESAPYRNCDYCRNDIPTGNIGIHEATCIRHHVKCLECGEFVSKSGREEHEHLYHTVQRCEKCGMSYKPINKDSHDSICQFSKVTCSFCDSHVIRKDFREHREACGARTERCENCAKYVMLKDTTTHICGHIPLEDFTTQIGTIASSGPIDNVEEMVRRQQEIGFSNLSYISNPVATHITPRQEYIPPRKIVPPTDRGIVEPQYQRDTHVSRQRAMPLERKPTPPHVPYHPQQRDTQPQKQSALPLERKQTPKNVPFEPQKPRALPLERKPTPQNVSIQSQQTATRLQRQLPVPLERKPLRKIETQPPAHQWELSHQRSLSKEPRQTNPFREPPREPMPPFNIFPPPPPPSSDTIITPQTRSFVSLSSLEDRLPKDEDSEEVPIDLEPNPSAPCEFCGNQVPLSALEGHQVNCKHRIYQFETETKYCSSCKEMIWEHNWEEHSRMCLARTDRGIFDQSIGSHQTSRNQPEHKPEVTPLHSSSLIPCEFCDIMFDFSEIKVHQNKCPNRIGSDFRGAEIPIQCGICEQYFEEHEVVEHRKGCVTQRHQQPHSTAKTFDSKSEKKKSEFCDREVSSLESHFDICYEKPRKCKYCLEPVTRSEISDHENTCSYHHFDSRPNTDLPFSTPATKFEKKKSDPITNKCPFCNFPYPSINMENHKNNCAKNPKFRYKSPPPNRTSPEVNLSKSLGPQSPVSPGMAPKFQYDTNPFRSESNSRKFPSTERTMDILNSPGFPSNDLSKYRIYSNRDPSPRQQTTSKQQQFVSPYTKAPSPTSLFRGTNEKRIAFSDIKDSKSEPKFVPITDNYMPQNHEFKCELKPLIPQGTRSNLKKPPQKPSQLNFFEKQPTIGKPLLTPTQDTKFMIFEPSTELKTRYTDTNASDRPQATTRKQSTGQYKYPRHNSPVTNEKYPDSFYTDKKEIKYPPGAGNSRDSYPRTSSQNPTETIVDPPDHVTHRRPSNYTFDDRYKVTKNQIHNKY